ncbi:MAG: FAD-binding and (Fe-S)-binding domain-containing protein, partial [Longimicrobiales bacterium]
QCCNVAVIIDFSKYAHHVIEVDAARRRARVEPGTILDDLRSATEPHGLTFGPDPATHNRCTLGGMIGNNSCGTHSVMAELYGPGARTDENVEALEILTYDGVRMRVGATSEAELERIIRTGGRRGEIFARLRRLSDRYADQIRHRFPAIPRRVAGYNLPALLPESGFNVARALVGSEGTCVTVLDATVTLMPSPRARALLVIGYPTIFEAGDHVPELRELRPIAIEGFDDVMVANMRKKRLHVEDIGLLPQGSGWLLVEFGGDDVEEATARARDAMRSIGERPNAPAVQLYSDAETQHRLWNVRESGLGATAWVPGEPPAWPGWEDSAVPVDRVGEYLRDLRALLDRYDYHCAIYGHFGQGCFHTRIDFDLTTEPGIEKYVAFTRDAAELVSYKYGGSISGEHGDGQARGDLLPIMYGDEVMEAFREFKSIWDPDHMMNPGKLVDAYPRDANLRLGSDYRPATPETHFKFPDDEGGFAGAALRCVGVGACRRLNGGTMCPSYMVLREEKDSTRGRAHLLFEMLQGDVITDGWKSEEVKESLDLCLACKGCKGDCPVKVDVATYKAEFLSHYYEGRLRPRSAYAFGLIHRWARLAALAPGVVNFVTGAPLLRRLAKAAAGIAPERRVPRFARQTFKVWWRARSATHMGEPRRAELRTRNPEPGTRNPSAQREQTRVLLWPDTFNNHFHPQTLAAAVEVLEAVGCDVEVPGPSLCCGRPLYDFGMLDTAKRRLREIIDALRPDIEAGTPLIGLEPSCVAVFRDELVDLF